MAWSRNSWPSRRTHKLRNALFLAIAPGRHERLAQHRQLGFELKSSVVKKPNGEPGISTGR